jgi:hypothetical protein
VPNQIWNSQRYLVSTYSVAVSGVLLLVMPACDIPTPLQVETETDAVDTLDIAMEMTLLPSMKFAHYFNTQSDGRQVLITPESRLVCQHGEATFTIRNWLTSERKAKEAGLPQPQRLGGRGLSVCNCQSTEGLNVKPRDTVEAPPLPESLFSFLKAKKTKSVVIKGMEGIQMPYTSGPTFLLANGRFVCGHGSSRQSLIRKQRSSAPSVRLPKCGCELHSLPVRPSWLSGVPLIARPVKSTPRPTPTWGSAKV